MSYENGETKPVSSLGPDGQKLIKSFSDDYSVLKRGWLAAGRTGQHFVCEIPRVLPEARIEFSEGSSGQQVRLIIKNKPPIDLDMSH